MIGKSIRPGGRSASMRLAIAAAFFAAVALAAPTLAAAANAYGQTFAGQATCLTCHGNTSGRWQVGRYVGTNHDLFIRDVETSPSALVPSSKFWPSPAYGGGLSFGSGDIKWMIAAPSQNHQYVTKYRNNASNLLGSGMTLDPIAGPSDDWLMPNGLEWMTELKVWENPSKTTARTYFQSCGGCHFLGVTRSTDITYTLASGAVVGPSTETSYSGVGIQCENCHGTGRQGTSHWTSGVDIVRTKQVLKSQTCGQCHVTGTAKQKNFVGGNFSSANGFTTDRKLEDFYNVYGTQYVKTAATITPTSIPETDTRYYPNGANRGMKHAFYNEWMLSGHARSLKYQNGSYWTTSPRSSCLACHSGEGFLASIGYGTDGPNDMALAGSSLASDTLNIECGVCHTVHGKQGDALGLRMEGEALCSACHNASLAPGTQFAAGAKVHHPSKEMRQGYGMIGVARPTKRFMGETGCPSCHMPKTSGELVSHRFKVMLPGDAEAWGVQANGDSCTPCHRSRTRLELQADLDEWADDLDIATTEAQSAIAAAKSRTASSTPGGVALIGSASTNIAFVEADSSRGAHNYPYAMEGLVKARYFARSVGGGFSRFGATSYDRTMQLAMVFGTLRFGDGLAAGGETVSIQAQAAGTTAWVTIGSAVTGADGDFAFAVGPTGTTSYRAVWQPLPGAQSISTTGTVTMGSTTTLSASSGRFALGGRTTLKGTVSPNHAGLKVVIRYKRGTSGTWRALASPTLGSTSTYAFTWRPSARGTYYLRTSFVGDPSHLGSKSALVTVKVY